VKCTLVGVQVGHVDLSSNQSGPHLHILDDFGWLADNPLESSIGLSDCQSRSTSYPLLVMGN